jgi:pimeloyl-ACP methyl ester carboxylesterase
MADAKSTVKTYNFRDGYAEVNNVRLHYVSSGEGKMIMFLHGFPEFWAEWENQLLEFGRDHLAVAVDLRGYNLSSKPDGVENYSVAHIAKDLKALAEHLGQNKFILVAHDWGGGVAWYFANRYPDLLDKLVIINSPHPAVFARELLNNPAQRKASQYMLLFRTPEAEELLSKNNYSYLLDALTKGKSKRKMSEDERKRYIEAWSQPGALTGGLNYYRVSPVYPPTSPDDENRLKAIANIDRSKFAVTVPTLVIWGELDTALTTGNLKGLEDYVSNLTIERIPDGSHWVINEQPELVNSLMREFIKK